jgi:aldehyde:ferredoxin oxidoreductase
MHVGEEGIALCDASALWGKNTEEAQDMMGKGGKLAIGVAGENLVRYACVVCQERVAGRGGIGAVFGYKQLKGIVAEGSQRVSVSNADKFKVHSKKWVAVLQKHPLTGGQLPKLGTAGLVNMMQRRSLLATKNYSRGRFEGFNQISGETLREEHLVKNKGCVTCPIQCGRVVRMDGREVKGPELETLGLLGPNLLNGDLARIIRLNHLCDAYGIDTMSFGGSVGFAMELNERGLWDNGLRFGEWEGELEALISQVAHREGVGDDLAEGVRLMAEKYGGGEYAIHVKGMELAAYEPRAAQGMGLGYATANRGGCHLNGGYLVVLEGLGMQMNGVATRGKAALTVFFQDLMEAASAGGSCLFTTYAVLPSALVNKDNRFARIIYALIPYLGGLISFLHSHAGLLGINMPGRIPYPYAYRLITGCRMNIGRFLRAGERIYNLERMINIRQGLVDGDTLPARLTDEAQTEGERLRGVRLPSMLKQYYRIRGWDEHGAPRQKKLAQLGL